MKTKGNTILITGGATGIGFALAEEFVNADNQVIICGRREEKLAEAKKRLPSIYIKSCDLSKQKGREELFEWVSANFKELNILVNNAGIQREIDFRKGANALLNGDSEIEINLNAPIHLTALFIPMLMKQKESAIVNVSSGLGFVPISIMPIYCATKAATHSFTISLRHQLRNTPIKVFELIPPTVDTELDRGARAARGQADRGIPPTDVAKAALKGFESDEYEIAVEMADNIRTASRQNPEQFFENMNRRFQ